LIQPYSFIQDSSFELTVNNESRMAKVNYLFLTFFIPHRFWHILKYFIMSSYYYSPRAQRFGDMYQMEINLSFAAKCIIKNMPVKSMFFLLVSNVFLGGYLIRIWERLGTNKFNEDLDNLQNCLWYSFVTMSTVGYGDYSATSTLGRIIACLISIIGILITATMTVVLTENFTFKGGELKAYNMLNQIELKEKLDNLTKKLCTKCFRISHLKTKKQQAYGNPKLTKQIENLHFTLSIQRQKVLKTIKELKEEIKSSFQVDPIELVIDKLADVKKEIRSMKSILAQFENVMEDNKENQRNLESLKNTIMSQNEGEE
jgi:low affinity Fe/Cu permease